MAKLNEQVIVITVSKLLRTGDPVTELLDEDQLSSLEAVITELVGKDCLVEILVNPQ